MEKELQAVHSSVVPQEPADARGRLFQAAEKLFAEKGLEATSVRDLAHEAGVNVAAVSYYFGSKENLYLELLRRIFLDSTEARSSIVALQELYETARLSGTPEAARQAIRSYIDKFMHGLCAGASKAVHVHLMSNEMRNPTQGLDFVFEEYVMPRANILVSLVEQARPDLAGTRKATLSAISIVGQCLHYRITRPIALRLVESETMTPELETELANHIADFSLAALSVV